jgi:hypothetical protein
VRRPHSQASPATDPAALPPRPGFRRSFTLRCSRTKGLDPPRLRGLFARGREDRAPLSTSAIKTIVEHNRLIDRTPLTTPRVAPEHGSRPADKDSFRRLNPPAGRVAERLLSAQPAEMSRARGRVWGFTPKPAPSSAKPARNARACGGSLSPTRSAQTPHVASSLRRRYGETCAAKILNEEEPSRARLAIPLSRDRREGRTTLPLAKGRAIRRTQGAFHRLSIPMGEHPRREASLTKGGFLTRSPPSPAWLRILDPALFVSYVLPARQSRGSPGIGPHG